MLDVDPRVLAGESLTIDATEALAEMMEMTGTSRAELARLHGVSRSRITHIMRGGNLTTRTLADLAFVMGFRLSLKFGKVQVRTEADARRDPQPGDVFEKGGGTLKVAQP